MENLIEKELILNNNNNITIIADIYLYNPPLTHTIFVSDNNNYKQLFNIIFLHKEKYSYVTPFSHLSTLLTTIKKITTPLTEIINSALSEKTKLPYTFIFTKNASYLLQQVNREQQYKKPVFLAIATQDTSQIPLYPFMNTTYKDTVNISIIQDNELYTVSYSLKITSKPQKIHIQATPSVQTLPQIDYQYQLDKNNINNQFTKTHINNITHTNFIPLTHNIFYKKGGIANEFNKNRVV